MIFLNDLGIMRSKNYNLKKKCEKIKYVITDVDGVLTDGGMYYSEKGETLKKFNTKDGMAVELLRENGIDTIFMTKEKSDIAKKRALKLKISSCLIGVERKEKEFMKILKKYDATLEEFAYIGDDINDFEVMKLVGFSAAPKDCNEKIKKISDYLCDKKGGDGVLREVSELIISFKKNVND